MEIKIALAGNPNCGKTTLFNDLTGSAQYVGNWPGVTVEKKDGRMKSNKDVVLQDLPGIYSLSPYTLEEVVTRKYLVNEKPDVIINIIDGTNIERNLYLTTQILELNIPVVIALNMMDLVKKNGDSIDIKKLSDQLGCKIVMISALKGEGEQELAGEAIDVAKHKMINDAQPSIFNGEAERVIEYIEENIKNKVSSDNLRWYAVKLFERDENVIKELALDNFFMMNIEMHIKECEKKMDDDSESIIINQRYAYIQNLVNTSVVKKKARSLQSVSDKIDRVVTNRILALPVFAIIMFLVYYISVTTLGTIFTDWTNDTLFGTWIQPLIKYGLKTIGASDWLISMVVDGIIGGLAAPIGFAPQMALVFFFLSILEDCGYMSRVAFIMDRIFRRFGLSGKSFIPFMISSGCGVPAIMASRTIENEKDRRMTMITSTFIPCGAKLPIIAVIAGFIMGGAWWVAPMMYFAGIILVIISCVILKKTKMFAGKPAPFVMELPQYHIPSIRGIMIHVWERVWAFLKKAGTILFLCCLVMWFLGSFGISNGIFETVDPENCFLSDIGNAIAWIFVPLGFGTWQAVASSLSGFVAKEGIVSTMGVLSGLGDVGSYTSSMHDAFAAFFPTNIAAVSFMLFNLFDSPCLAAISTMAKEMGSRKFFWFAIVFQNVMSYCIALIVYQIGGLATGDVSFGPTTVVAFILIAGLMYLLFKPDRNKIVQVKIHEGT